MNKHLLASLLAGLIFFSGSFLAMAAPMPNGSPCEDPSVTCQSGICSPNATGQFVCSPSGSTTVPGAGSAYASCSACLQTQAAANCVSAGACTQTQATEIANQIQLCVGGTPAGIWRYDLGICSWPTAGGTGGTGGAGGTGGGAYSATCTGTTVAGVCFPSSTGLPDPSGGVKQIATNLLNWLLGIFTTIAIIAFVISGFQYLTSAGDDKQIETAKRNMTWSMVGVLVGLSGFVIIQAVNAALNASSSAF